MALEGLIFAAVIYGAALFAIAFWAERHAPSQRLLRSSAVYTLSLSIYCTAWTFYGAVGYAARSGLEYLTIYLGPSLVMLGWWSLPRLLVRLGGRHRLTSIADLLSARFGKSSAVAVAVTLIALVGVTPYISLQLQSIAASFSVFATQDIQETRFAFWAAIGLAIFTILFGTRRLDHSERHHGVVMAIAVEAVVKLIALMAVGGYVVWQVGGGLEGVAARLETSDIAHFTQDPLRWAGLSFLSGAAFLCLPRMFQVMVVENTDPQHLATAGWAFPLYIMLMSLFVVPIALVGQDVLPNANPDLYVLSVPHALGAQNLELLVFLGGLSSAMSMVIVAALALSTMLSNHIILPLWISYKGDGAILSGDMRDFLLRARRGAIGAILALGYGYYVFSASGTALSSIGLIAFVGIVQILPALLAAVYWRGATRWGAMSGMAVGFCLWLWTLLLPSLAEGGLFWPQMHSDGPWGIGWLRPQSLFGFSALDPLMHALFWSLTLNTAILVVVSLFGFPSPLERMQAADFVGVLEVSQPSIPWRNAAQGTEAEDLLVMVQRLIGPQDAQRLFREEAVAQGRLDWPEVTPAFAARLERILAGAVGAATAHAMLGRILRGAEVSVEDLLAVAGETAELLEARSRLEATAAKLTALSYQKDAFLSQISHELRTPMSSIRAFAGLLSEGGLEEAQSARFAGIIDEEARRLTRLLDDLLELSVLESGAKALNLTSVRLVDLVEQAARTLPLGKLRLRFEGLEQSIVTDPDQVLRVFINLISNAVKYCQADLPVLYIRAERQGDWMDILFEDNGKGIAPDDVAVIFEKFVRLSNAAEAGGAGLGLAISAQIMRSLGGSISYVQGGRGAAFRVMLPMLKAGPEGPAL